MLVPSHVITHSNSKQKTAKNIFDCQNFNILCHGRGDWAVNTTLLVMKLNLNLFKSQPSHQPCWCYSATRNLCWKQLIIIGTGLLICFKIGVALTSFGYFFAMSPPTCTRVKVDHSCNSAKAVDPKKFSALSESQVLGRKRIYTMPTVPAQFVEVFGQSQKHCVKSFVLSF